MSYSQNDLRGQKNLGPRTFGAKRAERVGSCGTSRSRTRTRSRSGDPARGENTTLRDAAEETSRQDRKRPDIPLLEAEGRGTPETLDTQISYSRFPNATRRNLGRSPRSTDEYPLPDWPAPRPAGGNRAGRRSVRAAFNRFPDARGRAYRVHSRQALSSYTRPARRSRSVHVNIYRLIDAAQIKNQHVSTSCSAFFRRIGNSRQSLGPCGGSRLGRPIPSRDEDSSRIFLPLLTHSVACPRHVWCGFQSDGRLLSPRKISLKLGSVRLTNGSFIPRTSWEIIMSFTERRRTKLRMTISMLDDLEPRNLITEPLPFFAAGIGLPTAISFVMSPGNRFPSCACGVRRI